ncbi:MAG: ribosomal RNA small subunit methyltransferase A [Spirochaetales bacterium]|nr:ribosomal RNA small subunit methyltransferase A [Spirochaetales bacterium]
MHEDSILNLNYDSPQEIKELLEVMGLGPRKRWGQNFLINSGARKRIVDLLEVKEDDTVWEFGPGLGSITKVLLDRGVNLKVFEIDPGYIEYLKKAFESYSKFSIVEGDVIKTWKKNRNKVPSRFVGNLPYNISTDIISSFIENDFLPERMIFTVQREMGQRMTAKPNNKNYSSFAIICQCACEVKEVGVLKPGSFYPVPGVASAIISMVPHKRFRELTKDEKKCFFTIVKQLFTSRRKTLKNNISLSPFLNQFKKDDIYQVFSGLNIDITKRAEDLSVEQYVELAKIISKL